MQYSDTGPSHQLPPSVILDRFVNGEPLPNSSQLADLKTAWSAFMELRKRSTPPQPFVVLRFVDRALSTVEETLIHGDKTRELVRWSARLRRVLKQLGDIEFLTLNESAHVLCLLTRIHALLGRFDDVPPDPLTRGIDEQLVVREQIRLLRVESRRPMDVG